MSFTKHSVTFLIMFINLIISAQAQSNQACVSAESSQFDFWVGDWSLEWQNSNGEKEYGSNTIDKILGSCIIEENFSNADGSFQGKSFSVFNVHKKEWQQTWVDNTGAYMIFTGGFSDGRMTLSRNTINKEGKEIVQRMVFYDIGQNEFWWNWESSADGGKTWKLMWKILYKRKA